MSITEEQCVNCGLWWDVGRMEPDFMHDGVCMRCRYRNLELEVKKLGYNVKHQPDGGMIFVGGWLDKEEREKAITWYEQQMKKK